MNSKERVMAALHGESVDRVPVFIMSRQYAMRHHNLTFQTCLQDLSGEAYAEAQVKTWDRYPYDGLMDLEGVSAESEALGCELSASENESPTVTGPRLRDFADLEQIEIPDFAKSQALQRQFNVVKAMRAKVSAGVPIYANVQCPFRSAAMMRGISNFLLDLIENPDEARALLDLTAQMAIRYGKGLADAGSDILMLSNPLGSGNLISKQHYEEFVFPYDKKVVDTFKEDGIATILHICGKTRDRLNLIADTGYDGVSIDSIVDLEQAQREVGDRICLIGNVDVFHPLRDGTPQEVTDAALACISAGSAGRFMLSASCEVIADTPASNLLALIDAARPS